MGGNSFGYAVSPVYREKVEVRVTGGADINVHGSGVEVKRVQELDCTCPLDEYIHETVNSTSRSNLKRLWKPSEITEMKRCPKHSKEIVCDPTSSRS